MLNEHGPSPAGHVDASSRAGSIAGATVYEAHLQRPTASLGPERALARQQHEATRTQLEGLVRIGVEAHHRRPLGGTGTSLRARPARPRSAPDSGEHPQREQGGQREACGHAGAGVADFEAMPRRRPRPLCPPGKRLRAGDLAVDAIRKIVPPEQLELTRVRAVWPELAGGRLHTVAWPAALRGGTLWIHVLDNQWLHELAYMRHDLLARIRRGCPAAGVSDLRVRVGEVHVPDDPVRPVVVAPPPSLADEPSQETRDALSAIEDPGLRQTIANTRMALSKRVRG